MSTAPPILNSSNTRIVVDTSSNVPDELLARYRMLEVPTLVIFGEESFQNKHELSEAAFYEKFAAAKALPTTSQPPPALFSAAYRQALAEGAEHIVLITVSSKLSGTFRSGQMAAQEIGEERFTLWDSNSISMGSGWQAILAARMVEEGIAYPAFVERMTKLRAEVIGFAALETLKYVARSGRVSNLQAGIGELLQVKPLLELWDGNAAVCARVRGRKKSFQEVIERLAKFYGSRPIHAGMIHGNARADAEQLLGEARQTLNIIEHYYSDIGPAIAALAGPGVVGLAACPADV
jgi:DegV family protein with EDD domain